MLSMIAPKAVPYHESNVATLFILYILIGHSLGRMESRIKKFTPHVKYDCAQALLFIIVISHSLRSLHSLSAKGH